MTTSRMAIRALVTDRLHTWYGLAPSDLPDDLPLAETGLTSRDAIALTAALSELSGRRLPNTFLWDAPTIDAMVMRLAEDAGAVTGAAEGQSAPPPAQGGPQPGDVPLALAGGWAADAAAADGGAPGVPADGQGPGAAARALGVAAGPVVSAPLATGGGRMADVAADGRAAGATPVDSPARAEGGGCAPGSPTTRPTPGVGAHTPRAADGRGAQTPVAIIGLGCRLPGGVRSPEAYWRLLSEGHDAVGTLPPGRWEPFVRHPARLPDDVSLHGAFLGGIDEIAGFDAEFFGIAGHEAVAMDPQHRMLLEVAREALDHAALPAPALAGTRTGVFVGISGNEYAHLTTADPGAVDAWTATGASLSIAAGRLSYALDLRGPSMSVDTACSSSLVAVHHAVRSLVSGESDTALAAGVNLLLSPAVTLGLQRAGALAPDGRCKAFDAEADGIVRGEGCGVVVLKRLADAERDGDRVLAVIHATAVNSDGRSNGLTAPNAEAQRALLTEAHQAHPGPATVDYVEAHGTGTALGDPIEAGALGAVLGRGRPADQPLLIGSAKTNLGHLEAAAGIAGLIKTVLALHHGEIPGQLHFTRQGPHADLDALALRVVTAPEPWPRYSGTATAGVSAFGFGGTNAHVVLAEPDHRPARRASSMPERPRLLLLDGPTKERVRSYAAELAAWLNSPDSRRVRDADLARTLAGRTGRGRHRAALVTRDRAETVTALTRLATGAPSPHLITGEGTPGGPGPVWVFSGYGSQWPGMGSQLLATEGAFADAIDRLEPLLREHAGVSLRAGLHPDTVLSSPATVMPVLYGIQVALAELWRSYGLEPAAVIGHSLGEIAAAVVSGALDEATGARIIAVRSRLLDRLTGGSMAVVDLPAVEIPVLARELRTRTLDVAVHASPVQCVITGSAEDVAALVARVNGDGGFARALGVSGAGHSPEVEPLLGEFTRELGEIRHSAPAHRCRRYTTVLDDPREAAPADTAYWAANLRNPVRFTQAVHAAAEDGHRVFVEVAPHATQLHPLTETLRASGAGDSLVVPTLRRDTDDALTFGTSLATLLVHGVRTARPRERLHPEGRIVDVPPPRWRHRRFWVGEDTAVDPAEPQAGSADRAASPVERLRLCVAGVMGYSPEHIDPDTPLTDLGLDSLTAVRIRTVVQREFDVDVEPGVLLKQGTLRGVAELLGGNTDLGSPALPVRARPVASDRLRAFSATGPHAPLFLAHAAGGSADVYARLAARLDGDRQVHGFDRQPDPDDVPGRAAEFARRIREVSPNGPWTVGGWSYGGVVAQETARLLSPYGTVAALVLIDSILPLPTGLTATERALRHFHDFAAYVERTYGTRLDLPYDELAELDDTDRIELVLKVLSETVELPDSVLEHQRTSYLDLRSGERHTPGPHPGRTLLYRASEPAPHTVRDPRYERDDQALGWDPHCTDLTVVPLPGHHLSLLDPPVVDVLAGLLTRDLRDL